MTRRSWTPLLLLCAATWTQPGALADRLHLEGGGVIVTDDWWMEGDTLIYQTDTGTVGIPRRLVLRIDDGGVMISPPELRAVGAGDGVTGGGGSRALERRRRALELFAEGKADMENRDFESASTRFRNALREDPDLTAARVWYAVSEMAVGRDGVALSIVLEGLSREPDNADLHELMGDLRDREERVRDAVRSWRRAFELAPNDRLREKITKAERELNAGGDYAFSTTSHFNVRYDADVDQDMAAAVMDFLEEQFWTLSARFDHSPPQPITVLLYPTRQFRDVTQAPDSVAGLYDGKIRVPLGGLKRVDSVAKAVLVHELTHAVVHSKTRGNCPKWLHEGLAQLSEGRQISDPDREAVAQLLASGDPADWQTRGFSYAAALMLTRYLESRRGFYGLVDVLQHLGDGEDLDSALVRIYSEGYASLCRRWAREDFDEDQR